MKNTALIVLAIHALIALPACTSSTQPESSPQVKHKEDTSVIHSTKHKQAPGPRERSDDKRENNVVVLTDQVAPAGKVQPIPPESKIRELEEKVVSKNRPKAAAVSRDSTGHSTMARQLARKYIAPTLSIVTPIQNRENYGTISDNPVKLVTEHPVSTFSIDVDTGSYANVRRFLKNGSLPPHNAVRVEEMVNYFSYNYPAPGNTNDPFSVTTEMAPAPWNSNKHLLHIGVKGYEVPKHELPATNLVFLVDVSGSMRSANKLGLLKTSLKLLTRQMDNRDRISIVVYAGASGVVLEPAHGDQTAKINAALDALRAGGSTNGGAGIKLAYSLAQQSFIDGGINRVILATDGDFNVGVVNFDALKQLIEEKRKSGISLTTLGFGTGNYNDHLMEQLADAGNGNYAYIDTINEAQKVLVDEMTSTLQTIAKDVKIQVEFNPAIVHEYRLIGYVNRMLRREDFNNDKIDAGEIGAGHTVTALYEVTLNNQENPLIDPLRYQKESQYKTPYNNVPRRHTGSGEIAFLKMRYKQPQGNVSKLLQWPIKNSNITRNIAHTTDRFRFAAAVSAFGQKLRGAKYLGEYKYSDIMNLAQNARNQDPFGYRGEFVSLINLTQSLSGEMTRAKR